MKASRLALTLSVATAALTAGSAFASTTPIYGGGGTLAYSRLVAIGDCVSALLPGGDGITAQDSNCDNTTANGYEYLLVGVGSGAGQDALLTETSPTITASGKTGTDTGFTYPYAAWMFTDSDAPSDTPYSNATSTSISKTVTFYSTYKKAALPATQVVSKTTTKPITVAQTRGQIWQFPEAATPITLPYNNANMVFTKPIASSSPVSGTVGNELDLSTDQICYIWTKADAKGDAVPGNYDWSNPIFTATTTTTKKGTVPTSYGSNFTLSVASQAIVPIHRPDNSGSTYLFTSWLAKNCKGYTAAGYGIPATWPGVFPSFVVAASAGGGGGLVTAVHGTVGGIGYVSPDQVTPVKTLSSSTTDAAFVQSFGSKPTAPAFTYPTVASVTTAIGKAPPPKADALPTAWGQAITKKFFNVNIAGAYPIVGLTYLMGYQCYDADTASNNYQGVLDYLNFINNDPKAPAILAQGGLVSLASATAKNAAGLTWLQAENNLVNTDAKTALIGLHVADYNSGAYGTTKVGGKKGTTVNNEGPKACPHFWADANRT